MFDFLATMNVVSCILENLFYLLGIIFILRNLRTKK